MEKLLQIIAEVLEADAAQLTYETSRDHVEMWDSMAHIQIIAELEEQLGIKIPFDQIPDIKTIGDFAKYIGE